MKKYLITVTDQITGSVIYTKRVSVTHISKAQLQSKANRIAMDILKDENRPAKGAVRG